MTPLSWMQCIYIQVQPLSFSDRKIDVSILLFHDSHKRDATRPFSESFQNRVGHYFLSRTCLCYVLNSEVNTDVAVLRVEQKQKRIYQGNVPEQL